MLLLLLLLSVLGGWERVVALVSQAGRMACRSFWKMDVID